MKGARTKTPVMDEEDAAKARSAQAMGKASRGMVRLLRKEVSPAKIEHVQRYLRSIRV